MSIKKLSQSLNRWFYKKTLNGYLLFKPIFLPFIIRSPRIHRFLYFSKEAGKAIIDPAKVAPPKETDSPGVDIVFSQPTNQVSEEVFPSRLPAWLLQEWKEIHFLEPSTFPESALVNSVPFYEVPSTNIGKPYLKLLEQFNDRPTHVFLVPWLRKGGADLEVLNLINGILKISPDSRPIVIGTYNIESEWKRRLPPTVKFIELGRQYSYLTKEEQEKLLARLLLQTAPSVIHNINSELAYDLFAKYGGALSEASKLYANSFCGDRSPEGRLVGYPFGPLNDCYDYLAAVITDNQAHIDDLVQIYGMEPEKLFCLYQPAPEARKPRRFEVKTSGKSKLDVLWAGRIDRQKRPDILLGIAEMCKDIPITFHVFGSSVLEEDIFSDRFALMDNVAFHGPFDGLTSLNPESFDLFLNTSEWEGLPNILLEAMSLGLPVVSSSVGGIPELIENGETGFLVDPFDDLEGYRSALSHLLGNRQVLSVVSEAASKFISQYFCWGSFVESLAKIPGYIGISQKTFSESYKYK